MQPFFSTTHPPLLWGIPPRPNLSFLSARKKELKKASTYPKSFPIWKDYRIIADSLLSSCFCKAGRRLIFFLCLRLDSALMYRVAIINKNIASSRDTRTLRKIDSAIFRFSPRLRRGDTGRGGAPLGKGDGGLRKNTCRVSLHKRGMGVSPYERAIGLRDVRSTR